MINIESGVPVNLTASGALSTGACRILGFYVNSTSSGTIVFSKGIVTGGTAVSGTITPAIGWHRFPADMPTGAYVTIANTLNVTVFANPY